MDNYEIAKEYNTNIVKEYLEVLAMKDYSMCTLRNYKSTLSRYNDYLNSIGVPHYDIEPKYLHKYILGLDRGYSNSTVNMQLSSIRSLYTYMTNIGAIKSNPVNSMMYRKIERTMPPYVNQTYRRMFFAYLKNHSYSDLEIAARIMFATGLRHSEVKALDLFRDVEQRDDKLYVHVRRSKSKNPRIVPVFDSACADLMMTYRMYYYDVGEYKLQLSQQSWPYHTEQFQRKHNVRITPHIMRYSFATDRAREKMPINTIRLLLGHQSLNTTLLYISVSEDEIYDLI